MEIERRRAEKNTREEIQIGCGTFARARRADVNQVETQEEDAL